MHRLSNRKGTYTLPLHIPPCSLSIGTKKNYPLPACLPATTRYLRNLPFPPAFTPTPTPTHTHTLLPMPTPTHTPRLPYALPRLPAPGSPAGISTPSSTRVTTSLTLSVCLFLCRCDASAQMMATNSANAASGKISSAFFSISISISRHQPFLCHTQSDQF